MSICTFFGHRDCTIEIAKKVHDCIENLICTTDVDTFYIGNQGNFDTIVINELKELKQTYTHIKYFVVLAYLPAKKDKFTFIGETIFPQGIESVPKKYAIDYRNKWMLNYADSVVCYVSYSVGGAYKFMKLARKLNKQVINLYEQ